jgi:hypothetical protein
VDCSRHLLGRFYGQPLIEFSGSLLAEFLWRVGGQSVDIWSTSFYTYLLGVRLIFSRSLFTPILVGVRSLFVCLFSHLC